MVRMIALQIENEMLYVFLLSDLNFFQTFYSPNQ